MCEVPLFRPTTVVCVPPRDSESQVSLGMFYRHKSIVVTYSFYEVGIITPFPRGKNGESGSKIEREEVICLSPHTYQGAELGFDSRFSGSWPLMTQCFFLGRTTGRLCSQRPGMGVGDLPPCSVPTTCQSAWGLGDLRGSFQLWPSIALRIPGPVSQPET